jgi:hypothetical protein
MRNALSSSNPGKIAHPAALQEFFPKMEKAAFAVVQVLTS